MKKSKVGSIEIQSGKIVCSDPCVLDPDSVIVNAKNGTYNIYVTTSPSGYVKKLTAIHQDDDYDHDTLLWEDAGYCMVDSGYCGIFDSAYYKKNRTHADAEDSWYERHVIKTYSFSVTDNSGCISSSGHGDGWYPVLFVRDTDEDDSPVVAIEVLY